MSGGVSEYVDRDTAESIQTGRETVGVALRTAQERLQRVFVAFTLGLLFGVLAMRLWVWPYLRELLLIEEAAIIAQTPFDVILMQAKVGIIVGILWALPVLVYYAKEPLRERGILPETSFSRVQLAGIAVIAVVLAVVGVAYAHLLFFPILFEYLATNALMSGFAPRYGIIHWTEFILALSGAFAISAEMPLVMATLSYSNVVAPETWRAYLRHAALGMVVLGTLINGSPEPVSALIIAVPMTALYGVGIVTARIVAHRGQTEGEVVTTASLGSALRERWNVIAAVGIAGGALGYVLWDYTTVDATIAAAIGVGVDAVGMGLTVLGALLALAIVVAETALYERREVIEDDAVTPETMDLGELSVEGVRAAPPERFEAMTEEEAVSAAREAMRDDRAEKAQAILDRYDDPQAVAQTPETTEASDEESDPFTRTATGMVDAFTEEETTEDDIGGYYYDIRFIASSLRSRAFHLLAVFLGTMMAVFTFLYRGGIGVIRRDFLSRIPASVRPSPEQTVWPITLHPVEALVFEMKLAALIGAVMTLPVLFYYAWPALAERDIIGGNRRTIAIWGVVLIGGFVVGSALGYRFVAPGIISYLVLDSIRAGMAISYRVNNFFWMVFMTTGGIGLLADVPLSMVLFREGGFVEFQTLYERWRVIVFTIFVFSAVITPGSLYTMLLVAVPLSGAYLLGLGALWIVTLGGRREGGILTTRAETA